MAELGLLPDIVDVSSHDRAIGRTQGGDSGRDYWIKQKSEVHQRQ